MIIKSFIAQFQSFGFGLFKVLYNTVFLSLHVLNELV